MRPHWFRLTFVVGILFACAMPAAAQMVRGNLGGGGPAIGGGLGGSLGGIGSAPGPLPLTGGTSLPDLRGTLPNIETPKVNLPSGQLPPAGNSSSNQHPTGTSDSMRLAAPGLARESSMNVNSPVRAAHGVNLDPHDPPESKKKEKDDDEEGSYWWVWLIVVAVVWVVATRKQ